MPIGIITGEDSMRGNVSVKQAAKILGKSELFVREAIAQGRLDIGCCIVGKHGRRSFYISPKKLSELTGEEVEDEKK